MKNIQLFIPKFRKEEIFQEMELCLNKGWTGLGYKTVEIEQAWKDYSGFRNAHFLNSSTSGLHLAVKILKKNNNWKDGDEIITTPLTFISTNHAILYENLTPVFADVDEYLCLDPISVESKITKKTKAIMFVGIGGNSGQYEKISELCKNYNLKLILDAAHMAGTFVHNKLTNKVEHVGIDADVTVFSYQAVKNLPTADSGMICFWDNELDQLARKLSWLGIDKDTYQRSNDKSTYKWEYDLVDLGYKYNGNSVIASMALVGLKYLNEDNQIRRKISEKYESVLSKNGIRTIKTHENCVLPSRHLFQIVVDNRDKFMLKLNDAGIYPGVHYRDNTHYAMYKSSYGLCPNSLSLSNNLISLPLHLFLTDDDVNYVLEHMIKINKNLNG